MINGELSNKVPPIIAFHLSFITEPRTILRRKLKWRIPQHLDYIRSHKSDHYTVAVVMHRKDAKKWDKFAGHLPFHAVYLYSNMNELKEISQNSEIVFYYDDVLSRGQLFSKRWIDVRTPYLS